MEQRRFGSFVKGFRQIHKKKDKMGPTCKSCVGYYSHKTKDKETQVCSVSRWRQEERTGINPVALLIPQDNELQKRFVHHM
jgi:hypothetical protein